MQNAGGNSKWVYIIAVPIIVISIALIINKSFSPETPKEPAFDIRRYYNDHKDFYGNAPLEEVAKDAYQRGFHNGEPDFETWKKNTGIEPIIQEDNDHRSPSLLDKFKEFKIPFPFRFDEESIGGYLFRFDRLTRTVEIRHSLGNNKYKWEPRPHFNNLQHVRDYVAKRDKDRQIRAIEEQTDAIKEQKEAMEQMTRPQRNSYDDYMKRSNERQLQENVKDIKNTLEAEKREREDRDFRKRSGLNY